MVLVQARCLFCHPAISVRAWKEMQRINSNQWPCLILSSSTTGLLMEQALLPLCWLSDASITQLTTELKATATKHMYPSKCTTHCHSHSPSLEINSLKRRNSSNDTKPKHTMFSHVFNASIAKHLSHHWRR